MELDREESRVDSELIKRINEHEKKYKLEQRKYFKEAKDNDRLVEDCKLGNFIYNFFFTL